MTSSSSISGDPGAQTETSAEFVELLKDYMAGSGTSFLWEQQLLNTPVLSRRLTKPDGERRQDAL